MSDQFCNTDYGSDGLGYYRPEGDNEFLFEHGLDIQSEGISPRFSNPSFREEFEDDDDLFPMHRHHDINSPLHDYQTQDSFDRFDLMNDGQSFIDPRTIPFTTEKPLSDDNDGDNDFSHLDIPTYIDNEIDSIRVRGDNIFDFFPAHNNGNNNGANDDINAEINNGMSDVMSNEIYLEIMNELNQISSNGEFISEIDTDDSLASKVEFVSANSLSESYVDSILERLYNDTIDDCIDQLVENTINNVADAFIQEIYPDLIEDVYNNAFFVITLSNNYYYELTDGDKVNNNDNSSNNDSNSQFYNNNGYTGDNYEYGGDNNEYGGDNNEYGGDNNEYGGDNHEYGGHNNDRNGNDHDNDNNDSGDNNNYNVPNSSSLTNNNQKNGNSYRDSDKLANQQDTNNITNVAMSNCGYSSGISLVSDKLQTRPGSELYRRDIPAPIEEHIDTPLSNAVKMLDISDFIELARKKDAMLSDRKRQSRPHNRKKKYQCSLCGQQLNKHVCPMKVEKRKARMINESGHKKPRLLDQYEEQYTTTNKPPAR